MHLRPSFSVHMDITPLGNLFVSQMREFVFDCGEEDVIAHYSTSFYIGDKREPCHDNKSAVVVAIGT